MLHQINDGNTKTDTAVGTLLTIVANIHQEDLIQTAILAAVGAIVSFCVSIVLKKIKKHYLP
jgi:mannitol-specific phosphotransferase system IIBC component